jgi:head-tail adaptor
MPHAGRKRQAITIEDLSVNREATYGEPQEVWTTFAQTWAEVSFVIPREAEPVMASQKQSFVRVKFIVNYIAGFDPRMRINWNGKYYRASAWEMIGNYAEAALQCEEWNEGRR